VHLPVPEHRLDLRLYEPSYTTLKLVLGHANRKPALHHLRSDSFPCLLLDQLVEQSAGIHQSQLRPPPMS
jgi:hypothetical protein